MSFNLPAVCNALRSKYSICELALRRSSAAHLCSESKTAGSSRSKNAFFFAMSGYWYSVPVLTTGCASLSPHSTTIRLLTIVALRSSSN